MELSGMGLEKTIYLVGPHSTGKSTLIKSLIQFYGENTPVLFEMARRVMKEKGYTALSIESGQCFQMQRDIFRAQYEAEMKLAAIDQHFMSDRNAVDPIMYAKMYSAQKEDWKGLCATEQWNILAERYRDEGKSLVVLLEPVKNFLENDGTRKMPVSWNEWLQFGNMYKEFLAEQRIPFHVLGEDCVDIRQRTEKVIGWASTY